MSRFTFRTVEPTSFGSGWMSGVLSASFGLLGLGAVLCFRFPEILPTAMGPKPARVLQFLLLILVADFTQYWVHRTFHAVPWLWRFHAVHHSAEHIWPSG